MDDSKALLPSVLLLVLLVPVGTQVSEDPKKEVRELLAEFNDLAAPSDNLAEAIKKITKESKPFLEALHAVSSLAAAGMQFVFKPESDEYEAMLFLSHQMKTNFAEMENTIEELRSSVAYGDSLREYANFVTLNLDMIEPVFRRILDPEENPPLWRNDFLAICISETGSPLRILKWLNQRVNTNCPMPTRKEARIYARANELFFLFEAEKVLDHDAHLGSPLYDEFKRKTIVGLTSVSEEEADLKMAQLKEVLLFSNLTFANFADVWQRCIRDDKRFNSPLPSSNCILKEAIESNHWKREALTNVVEIVRRDITRLETIAGMCANISSGGSEEKMVALLNDINSVVVDMAFKIDLWAERKLALAWPHVILSHAKTRYSIEHLRLPWFLFNATATRAADSANSRGPQTYAHNIFITRNWDKQDRFWAPCSSRHGCTKAMDWRGTNLVVTRHPIMSYERTLNAHHWLESVRDNITSIISANWKTDSLPELLGTINAGIGGGIRDPTLFGNVVFVHNSQLEADRCWVRYGVAGTWVHLPNCTSFAHVDYFSNSYDPFHPNAEHFKLFFFL